MTVQACNGLVNTKACAAFLQDSTGDWGGSLILSTTTAGSSSSASTGQPVDRLTIDSSGLATFTAGQSFCACEAQSWKA